jgi:hypothetical protein
MSATPRFGVAVDPTTGSPIAGKLAQEVYLLALHDQPFGELHRMDVGTAVRLTHDVGDAARGTVGTVVALGPGHALVRLLEWDAEQELIVERDWLRPATLVGLPI